MSSNSLGESQRFYFQSKYFVLLHAANLNDKYAQVKSEEDTMTRQKLRLAIVVRQISRAFE